MTKRRTVILARAALLVTVWSIGIANAAAMWIAGMPQNAVKARAGQLLAPYKTAHVAHEWRLFAPNPVSSNYSVFARLKRHDGRVGAWIDVSTPLLQDVQRNRLSETQPVYEALSHAATACARQWRDRLSRCDGGSNSTSERVIVRTAYAQLAAMSRTADGAAMQITVVRSVYQRFGATTADVRTMEPSDQGPWLVVPHVAVMKAL